MPPMVVPLVHAVDLASLRDPDGRVRQDILADRLIQREAMHALACRIDEDCAGTIHDIAGRYLLVALLQDIRRHVIPSLAAPATDGKDRPNCDVAVDV